MHNKNVISSSGSQSLNTHKKPSLSKSTVHANSFPHRTPRPGIIYRHTCTVKSQYVDFRWQSGIVLIIIFKPYIFNCSFIDTFVLLTLDSSGSVFQLLTSWTCNRNGRRFDPPLYHAKMTYISLSDDTLNQCLMSVLTSCT